MILKKKEENFAFSLTEITIKMELGVLFSIQVNEKFTQVFWFD